MRINKEFICEAVDVLNRLIEGKDDWSGSVEFVDKETGFKLKFYEISRKYYRLDIINSKQSIDTLLVKAEEEVEDDKTE